MTIEFPSTKTAKDAIRAAIGRDVNFVFESFSACATCSGLGYYDEVNNSSLDSFCPNCSGIFWIPTESIVAVKSHVRWKLADESQKEIGGETFTGDCIITIASDALTSNQLASIKEIRVDSRKLVPTRTIPRGVPNVDRYRILARQWDKE
jgi:hypothetical protein